MELSVGEARALAEKVMLSLGHSQGDAALIADHLIDTELRGLTYGGLARAVSIAERFGRRDDRKPIAVVSQTPVAMKIDGGDQLGYLVAHRATREAIAKAKQSGIGIVAAGNTWYTGMLSYYAEMAAAEGLVTIIASNAAAWVAPHGATQPRFGTNPMCFGFPCKGEPVIWDVGTSNVIHADVVLHKRLGKELAEGLAFDAEGNPTRDPAAALGGAFTPWGGHKGSGLAIVVHLLGLLAGSSVMPEDLADFGFLIIAIDPNIFTPAAAWEEDVARYAALVRGARPVPGGPPVRMPFDRSRDDRAKRREEDKIVVADEVYALLSRAVA